MNFKLIGVILVISLVAFSHCQKAIAVLKGTSNDSGIKGTVVFTKDGEYVKVEIDIEGITKNESDSIALHIHQYGNLNSSDGTSAGLHFVGNGDETHGCPGEIERHAGDLGNFEVEDGAIKATVTDDVIHLEGDHSIIGRAVVLHSGQDDCTTQPTGNAGQRLAFGVIGIMDDTAKAPHEDSMIETAICVFSPTQYGEGKSGVVSLRQLGEEVHVKVQLEGFSGATHGFHIHQYGDINADDGLKTGSHYNPFGNKHGLPGNDEKHVGDLGNIKTEEDGVTIFEKYYTLNLTGEYGVLGRAMIIHALEDDGEDPAGNAGDRILQCVIGVAPSPTVDPTDEVPTGDTDSGAYKSLSYLVLLALLAFFF